MRSNNSGLTRRGFVVSTGAFAGAALLPVQASALSEKQAVDLINKVLADVFAIIDSGKPESQMLANFEGIFRDYADVPRIARYCLAASWRTASSAQQAAYTKAFQGYISRKYGRQFRKFAGAQVKIIRSRDAGSLGILVETSITLKGSEPYAVDWNVSDRSGKLKFINLIIEGMSMLAIERTEMGSILESYQGNMDKLIAHLERT